MIHKIWQLMSKRSLDFSSTRSSYVNEEDRP